MLVTMKEMLIDAKRKRYAIPAFDVSNYEMMKAILETCEEEKSPALLMGLGVALIYQGLAKLMKNDIIAITVASISGTFLNTLFFLTFFWAFFNNQENLFKVLITAMSVNFLIELIVNTILSIGLSKVVHLFKKRMA